ncbi:hypothetical protein, partial [Frankia sp. CiP1_Cm_nod2]|uniref:hypothetical protein n=1 Tax=Frankia sp. CiP1_Cm_nod2 TaxID=2897161 RepID=UPI00202505F6
GHGKPWQLPPRSAARPQPPDVEVDGHGHEKPWQPPARFFDEETDPSITRRADWHPRQDDSS